jgi:hypothetical protein
MLPRAWSVESVAAVGLVSAASRIRMGFILTMSDGFLVTFTQTRCVDFMEGETSSYIFVRVFDWYCVADLCIVYDQGNEQNENVVEEGIHCAVGE